MIKYLCLFFIGFAFTNCATIVKGKNNATITFVPNITPDRVILINERSGVEQQILVKDTMIVNIDRKFRFFKRSKYSITFFKSGFPAIKINLIPNVTFWYWLNIPLGGVWMVMVDPFTGAMYQYRQTKYTISF